MTTPICYRIHPTSLGLGHHEATLTAYGDAGTNFWASQTLPIRLITRSRHVSLQQKREELLTRLRPLEVIRSILPLLEEALATGLLIPRLSEQVEQHRSTIAQLATRLPNRTAVYAALQLFSDPTVGNEPMDAVAVLYDACQQLIWPWQHMVNYVRTYHVMESILTPLTVEHYCLVYPESFFNVDAFAQTLRHQFWLPQVDVTSLPYLFHGRYREEPDYLAPASPGLPFLAVLTAWNIQGVWSLIDSWQHLLMSDTKVALAIDVTTIPRNEANRRMTNAENQLRGALLGQFAPTDARSREALQAVQTAATTCLFEGLHEVAYAVLIEAPTRAALEKQALAIEGVFGMRLALKREVGMQREMLKLFTPCPSAQINAPLVRRNTPSRGVAVVMPYHLRKTEPGPGILIGIDQDEAVPIHVDDFGVSQVENAMTAILGRPGEGKTVFMLMRGLRLANMGMQVVMFDPVGKCARLCEAVGRGAAYYDVRTQAALNILDPMSEDLGVQVDLVIQKLQIVLGQSITEGERVRVIARPLTNLDIDVLEIGLSDDTVYGPAGHRLQGMTAKTAPLLEDLVRALRKIENRPEARQLAAEIEGRALRSKAHIYNSPTTLSWRFDQAQVLGYDFQHAERTQLPLLYQSAFTELNRWVRSAERAERGQKLVCELDEYWAMTVVPALESNVEHNMRTWRNFSASMGIADQSAATFWKPAGTGTTTATVTNLCRFKYIFRQESTDADLVAEALKHQLTPMHQQFMRTSRPGECIGVLGDSIHRLSIQLTDHESRIFLRRNTHVATTSEGDEAQIAAR